MSDKVNLGSQPHRTDVTDGRTNGEPTHLPAFPHLSNARTHMPEIRRGCAADRKAATDA